MLLLPVQCLSFLPAIHRWFFHLLEYFFHLPPPPFAGIFDGDTAIIRRADRANNGQIVVALVDNEEATLKVLDKKGGNEVWLLPCNKDYNPIKITADRLKIQGILYGIVRKYN